MLFRSRNTLSSRRYVLRSFVAHCGAATPRGITVAMVRAFHDAHAAHHAHTAAAYVNLIRWWLDWLIENGRLMRNVAKEFKLPKLTPRKRRQFMTAAQVRTLLDACMDADLKFAIFCGAHAGLRKGEVIEARAAWFDLDAKLLHVQTTETFTPKDRDNRTVPLTDEFCAFLAERGIGGGFVFRPQGAHGKSKYRADFQKSFNALLERCGLGEFTFHDLRRTFASLLVSRGVSIYKVSKWLGDEVQVVEGTYGHLIPQDDEVNASWR